MKRYILILVLLTSCLATKVENATMIPAMQSAWTGIRADIMKSEAPPTDVIALMDAAIRDGDRVALSFIDWTILKAAAVEGIKARVAAGEIGPGVALSLHERLIRFTISYEHLMSYIPRHSMELAA